jgi:23S rRNA (guanosine2251-2'-O)-methyltransferase
VSEGTVVYGLHAVESVLAFQPGRVIEVWLQDDRNDARVERLDGLAKAAGAEARRVPRAELDRIAGGGRHQGVAVRCRPSEPMHEAALKDLVLAQGSGLVLLVLDGVTDPHNLGACLRSADAAGVHAVVAPRDRAASLNPVVRKVASGAAETVPFVQVTNLARTLRWLKEQGVWVIGLAGDGDGPIWDMDLTGPVAIVMGAEGAGLRRLTRDLCDHLAGIPMAGTVGSLNVSVATGVALFEVVRQRIRAA